MDGVASGKFYAFTRAGHISAKAARALIEPLARGLVYSAACEAVGYNHAERIEVKLEDVRNPVARKAVTEMLKQVRAMAREFGDFRTSSMSNWHATSARAPRSATGFRRA